MLTDIAPLILKISRGQNLTAEEAQLCFDVCTLEDKELYYWVALTMGLHCKGETGDELWGLCRSTARFAPKIQTRIPSSNLIDVSGTGGDLIKTMNVGTAAAFVLAGAGVNVPKLAFRAESGLTGSSDIAQAFGVDMMQLCRNPEDLVRILESCGVVFYFVGYMMPPGLYRSAWPRKMAEIGLKYRSVFQVASFAYSPFPLQRRLYGVFDERYLGVLAGMFRKMGYQRGMVVHGLDGLDESSNIGPTKVVEYTENEQWEYILQPEDLGLRRASADEIRAESQEGNIADLLRVIYGVERGAKRDLVLANVGAALYLLDRVPTMREGVFLAANVTDRGMAGQKLEEFVGLCGDPAKLVAAKAAVGLSSSQ